MKSRTTQRSGMNNRCIGLLQTIFKAKEMAKKSEILKNNPILESHLSTCFCFSEHILLT